MESTLKLLKNSSFILGLVCLIYAVYALISVTVVGNHIITIQLTDKDFVNAFFMGTGIVSFGFYLDVKTDPFYKRTSFKKNGVYNMAVMLSVCILSFIGVILFQYLP